MEAAVMYAKHWRFPSALMLFHWAFDNTNSDTVPGTRIHKSRALWGMNRESKTWILWKLLRGEVRQQKESYSSHAGLSDAYKFFTLCERYIFIRRQVSVFHVNSIKGMHRYELSPGRSKNPQLCWLHCSLRQQWAVPPKLPNKAKWGTDNTKLHMLWHMVHSGTRCSTLNDSSALCGQSMW